MRERTWLYLYLLSRRAFHVIDANVIETQGPLLMCGPNEP
jgi:hypothetical protein